MDPQTPAQIGIHEFELTDACGVTHKYAVTEHPAGEGMEIMFALLSLGAPTVLGLAGAAVQSERMMAMALDAFRGRTSGETTDGDIRDLAGVAVGMDLPAVGRELGIALAGGKAPDITRKLMSRVTRDGQFLRNGPAFDMAFQANYFELITLIWRVCSINRFFPVPGTSESVSPPAAATTGTTPTPPPPAI